MKDYGVVEGLTGFYDFGVNLTRSTLKDERVQAFMKSKQQFDLVICEVFLTDAMLGFGQLFDAPVIAVSSFSASIFTNDLVGTPSPLSYVHHPFSGFSTKMSLGQRIANILLTSVERGFFYNYFYPRQKELFNEFFSESRSSLDDIRKNVSLVLLNTHFSLAFPRPYVPNMIEIGGIQVNKKAKELPKNIKDFIESAEHGVIYFSLGSNMKSKSLPEDKRDALIGSFKNLKQKVLWKWEDSDLPGKPDNVMIRDWFPQDDVLAHPNVKLFITHGGLLSTTESIYHGKPLIGIPLFGDQFVNMAEAEKGGYGLVAKFDLLTSEYFTEIINRMLNDQKYTKQAQEMSRRYRDQPLSPLETGIFWVEYVIRHKGAHHLKNSGVGLNFIQYHNIDAFCVLHVMLLTVLYIFYKILKKVVKSVFRGKSDVQKCHRE